MDGVTADDLYRRYGPVVYRRCLKLLRDQEEARDAAQEVFVRALSRLDSLSYGSPLPWLHEIATRHCLNLLRNDARRAAVRDRALRPQGAADLAVALADRSHAAWILRQVDDTTALVAIHHVVDGMTQEEIAERVGLSRKTVGLRLQAFFTAARSLVA